MIGIFALVAGCVMGTNDPHRNMAFIAGAVFIPLGIIFLKSTWND